MLTEAEYQEKKKEIFSSYYEKNKKYYQEYYKEYRKKNKQKQYPQFHKRKANSYSLLRCKGGPWFPQLRDVLITLL